MYIIDIDNDNRHLIVGHHINSLVRWRHLTISHYKLVSLEVIEGLTGLIEIDDNCDAIFTCIFWE